MAETDPVSFMFTTGRRPLLFLRLLLRRIRACLRRLRSNGLLDALSSASSSPFIRAGWEAARCALYPCLSPPPCCEFSWIMRFDAIPFHRQLRGAPADAACWRRRKWDASANHWFVLGGPLRPSPFGHGWRGRLHDAESGCKNCENCNRKSPSH